MKEPVAENDRSWASSPCSTCQTSPCCTRLPLHRFHIESRGDFERARSILEHPRLELGLYDSGWWMAYYLAPCRFLNPLDSKCLVHGSHRQPQICRDYSPVRCWYKRVFAPGAPVPTSFIRFDLRRFEMLAEMVTFDDTGELSSVPDWEPLHSRITALPLSDTTPAGRPIERVAPAGLGSPPRPAGAPSGTAPGGDRSGLIFPIRTPRTRRDLDLVRFRLGFHGVRIGVSGEEWVTVIGNPPEAERFLLVSYDELDRLLASFAFDDRGTIVGAPRPAPPPAIRLNEPGSTR